MELEEGDDEDGDGVRGQASSEHLGQISLQQEIPHPVSLSLGRSGEVDEGKALARVVDVIDRAVALKGSAQIFLRRVLVRNSSSLKIFIR